MANKSRTLAPLTTGRGRRGASFQAERADTFPSEASLLWFVRTHKRELVEAGAIVLLRGAWHADMTVFDEVLPRILRADALAKLDRE